MKLGSVGETRFEADKRRANTIGLYVPLFISLLTGLVGFVSWWISLRETR